MYRYALCKRIIDDGWFKFASKVIETAKKLGVEIIDSEEHISGSTTDEGFYALNFVIKAPVEIYIEFYKEVYQYPGFRDWVRISEEEFTEARFYPGNHKKWLLSETDRGIGHLYIPDERFNEEFAVYLTSNTPSYYACEHIIRPSGITDDSSEDYMDYMLHIAESSIIEFSSKFNKQFLYCNPRIGQPYLNPDGWYVVPIIVRVFSEDEIQQIINLSGAQEEGWVAVPESYHFQGIKLFENNHPSLALKRFFISLEDKAQRNLRKQNEN
jgi:hypothetical protein